MTFSPRPFLAFLPLAALCACAAPPVSEPQAVAVRADTLTREYSSFNARVLSDATEVDASFTASLDPEAEPLTRLESAVVQQLGEENLRVGDAVSSIGMWGTAVRYGGVQFGTRSATRDDVVDSTQLASTGMAVLPTVADALFASADASSAALAQQSLSVKRSLSTDEVDPWRLVARDAMGHSRAIDGPMIAGTRIAEEGCDDFSVGLGKVRQDYALTSNEYGPVFANTTVTCSAPLGFTIEGHGEYLADEVAALGVGVARKIGPIGTASLAFASSSMAGSSGWLAKLGFEHSSPLFNVMVRSRLQSRDFRDIGTLSLEDPIMQRDLASVGVNVTEGASLSLAYATQTTWARERTNLISVKQSLDVGRGSLSMSAGHSLEDNFGSTVFISYKRPLGTFKPARSLVDELDIELPDVK